MYTIIVFLHLQFLKNWRRIESDAPPPKVNNTFRSADDIFRKTHDDKSRLIKNQQNGTDGIGGENNCHGLVAFYASSRHWADPSICAWWIHCCHSSSRGAHQRTASPSRFRPMKMNSPLPCFTWHVNGTWSVPECSSVSSKLLVSTSLSVRSSSTPSIPFHFDGMAMRRLGVNGLLLLLLFAGRTGDRGRPLLTGSKTVEAWRMTRVARTLSSVRSNCSSLYTEEMKPRATKSLLQNISNDSLMLQGRHSAQSQK